MCIFLWLPSPALIQVRYKVLWWSTLYPNGEQNEFWPKTLPFNYFDISFKQVTASLRPWTSVKAVLSIISSTQVNLPLFHFDTNVNRPMRKYLLIIKHNISLIQNLFVSQIYAKVQIFFNDLYKNIHIYKLYMKVHVIMKWNNCDTYSTSLIFNRQHISFCIACINIRMSWIRVCFTSSLIKDVSL